MVTRFKAISINGLLLAGLTGLLIIYLVLVTDLPVQIYTASQREYIRYNAGRYISQLAPTWNVVQLEGQVEPMLLPVRENRVQATLVARYQEQEGVSATLYDLDFRGEYQLAHPGPSAMAVELFFPFPANLETLHEVRFLVDGEEPPEAQYTTHGIRWATSLQPGQKRAVVISYRADGAGSFGYGLQHNLRTDLDITVRVEGLTGSQVPKASLPATLSKISDGGETFTWKYAGLIADRDIQLNLPTRLSFTQRLARLQDDFRTLAGLAPVLVGLFLASLAGLLHLSGVRLQLESYLLTGLGLALFYPVLTFLSGLAGVIPASILALSLVTTLLTLFLGSLTGRKEIRWRVGLLLFVFLGLFSLGLLTRWRGILLSLGALSLVAFFMLLYARRPIAAEATVETQSDRDLLGPQSASPPAESGAQVDALFCTYCGRLLADDHSFCPGCGQDTSRFHRCADCGHQQFVPEEIAIVHCIQCGSMLSESDKANRERREIHA